MKIKRTAFFEVIVGLILVASGVILWLWSTQLFWIQIYPQPLAKTLIETIPYVFWVIATILVVDGVRRLSIN